METQSESTGATVGGGEVSIIRCLEATSIIQHWYHVINNKHTVQMYQWGDGGSRVQHRHMSISDVDTKMYICMMIPPPLAIVIKCF